MNKFNMLKTLRECFEKVLPNKDSRTNISPLEFVVSFVFCYLGDSKTFSLEAIRREMKTNLDQDISRSAFWERLSRERLKKFLRKIVGELMSNLATSVSLGSNILSQLGVTDIWVVDSSTITLKDGAKNDYPGTGTTAAHLSSHTLFEAAVNELDECQTMAISFQRISKVTVVLSRNFVQFLLNPSKHIESLTRKIKLFVNELFDPNYKNRETSLMRVHALLDNST